MSKVKTTNVSSAPTFLHLRASSVPFVYELHHIKVLPLVRLLKTNSLLPNYQLISFKQIWFDSICDQLVDRNTGVGGTLTGALCNSRDWITPNTARARPRSRFFNKSTVYSCSSFIIIIHFFSLSFFFILLSFFSFFFFSFLICAISSEVTERYNWVQSLDNENWSWTTC